MKKLLIVACMMVTALTALAQRANQYRNPVLSGFHPDPSCVRVGDDYYLVNSSFQYFPGVPIYHSKDLVSWEQVGNVLTRESQLPLKDATSWLGIYAPTIRYNDGTFYMITTNVGNGGNFLVTAKSPEGPWSEPVWLQQQGIDPSLLFEGDTCWMVSNPDGHITLCKIDPQSGRQLTPSRTIWDGTGGRYPEGPHLYKKDGYYYLLISEGGTELAHHLTIARSRSIYGPYEADPANPIMTNCNHKGEKMQIQGTGHGDFVEDQEGNWWVIFLAYRNFGGAYHHLGRETCLAPVEWKAGEWPTVYGGEAIDTIMHATTLPLKPMADAPSQYSFSKMKEFGPEWIHLGQPDGKAYEFTGKALRLHASHSSHDTTEPNTWVGLRQTSPRCAYEAEVDCQGLKDATAGLSIYQINDGHADLRVQKAKGGYKVELRMKLKAIDYIVGSETVKSPKITLKVTTDGDMYDFFVKAANGQWTSLGSLNCSLLSTEVAGGFTGITVGLFCNGGSGEGYADFKSLAIDNNCNNK